MFDPPESPQIGRLPKLSLFLSLLTYIAFGWLLHSWTSSRMVWLIAGFSVVVLSGFVVYPSRTISMSFGGFFKTDIRALILILLGCFSIVVLLTWLQFFVDALILCSAGLLVSLDLKVRKWGNGLRLLFIIGWQLLGLSIGLYARYFYLHPLSNLPPFFYQDYWLKLVGEMVNN